MAAGDKGQDVAGSASPAATAAGLCDACRLWTRGSGGSGACTEDVQVPAVSFASWMLLSNADMWESN